jgi:thiol-disulfide isomerase/thioredoxin
VTLAVTDEHGATSLALGIVLLSDTGALVPVGTEVGDVAPWFALRDLNGELISLGDLLGHVILIDFWATWCPQCLEVLPIFEEWTEMYHDQGLVLVSISQDRDEEKMLAFLDAQESVEGKLDLWGSWRDAWNVKIRLGAVGMPHAQRAVAGVI